MKMDEFEDEFEDESFDDPIDALSVVANTLVLKFLRNNRDKVTLVGEKNHQLRVAVERVLLGLEVELETLPEDNRLWGSVNPDMINQEVLKYQADSTGKPVFFRTVTRAGLDSLRHAMKSKGHGFYKRSLTYESDGAGGYNIHILPQEPVDPLANPVVD